MITEAENAPGSIQTSAAPPSTTVAKTSIFGRKSGFIIPKNKLSGSLVPVARGFKKGDAAIVSEEGGSQIQRKTKWGLDLLLDTTVRKGRVLAYQTRINQIEQQMTLGTLDIEGSQDSLSASESPERSDHRLGNEEMGQLELEKREIIGEILKLNAAYKAPTDYKPLLREAKVSVPIKEYPGYNFIALVFGPGSATLKRLEKETDTKIRVYGTKVDTGGKVEIVPSDGKETEYAYQDLNVHVSADTFEKVDSAVALIELLVNPVSVSLKSKTEKLADHISIPTVSHVTTRADDSDVTPSSTVEPVLINQGTSQPFAKSFLSPLGNSSQSFQTWFSACRPQTPAFLPSGLVNLTYSSAQLAGNIVPAPSSVNTFTPQPVVTTSFSPVLQNPSSSHVSQPSNVQHGPKNIIFPSFQGSPCNDRAAISSLPQSAYQMAYSDIVGPMASRVAGQQPRGVISPWFPPVQLQSIGPGQPTASRIQMHSPSANALAGSVPVLPHISLMQRGIRSSFPENAPTFDSIRPPPVSISRPSSAADFTFLPHRLPTSASQMPWQSTQPARQHVTPPIQVGKIPVESRHNQGFPRAPQLGHQMNQPRVPTPPNFGGMPLFQPRQTTVHHMQQRSFIPMGSSAGPPLRFRTPQPFPNTQQVCDPYSPTSGSSNPQMMGGSATKSHSENDPEYEDLMASVGVK